MSPVNQTYERIIRYLKGLLSDRERHDLEKDMMHNAFDDDAFDGLTQLTAGEFESDMLSLQNKIDNRIHQSKNRNLVWLYRIAAAFVLFVGIGSGLYFMFVKNTSPVLITQELKQTETAPPPETTVPVAPGMPEDKEIAGKDNSDKKQKLLPESNRNVLTENKVEQVVSDESEIVSASKQSAPESGISLGNADNEKAESIPDTTFDLQYITGRVLGINREALAGVSIVEQGTNRQTYTDRNGNFRLPVRNPASKLALKYNGYKSLEVPSREIAGREISMNEDLVAMNEVIVVDYGGRKSSDKKSTVQREAAAQSSRSGVFQYIKPVPPGGSLKEFENWVESKIDVKKFMDLLPGHYKIVVDLVVSTNGSLSEIRVKEGVPDVVAEEYKRVISLSPVWKPAMTDTTPVDAEIQFNFSLEVE